MVIINIQRYYTYMQIGQKIRNLRKHLGITLKQLSTKTALSQSYLSQIERELSQPSITALVKITQAMGVTMQWLFSDTSGTKAYDPKTGHGLIKKHQRATIEYEDGTIDQLLIPKENSNFSIIYTEYTPHSISETYSHKGHEAVTVLSGELYVNVGDKCYFLEEGDCLSFPSNQPHGHENRSDKPTSVMWFITPATF